MHLHWNAVGSPAGDIMARVATYGIFTIIIDIACQIFSGRHVVLQPALLWMLTLNKIPIEIICQYSYKMCNVHMCLVVYGGVKKNDVMVRLPTYSILEASLI